MKIATLIIAAALGCGAIEAQAAPPSAEVDPKAVDALTQTEFARDWVEIGKTCNNIHKQGTNRTMKAVGRSSRESRFRSLVRNVSAAVSIAIATTAETNPSARLPSTTISVGSTAISRISTVKAAVITDHHGCSWLSRPNP